MRCWADWVTSPPVQGQGSTDSTSTSAPTQVQPRHPPAIAQNWLDLACRAFAFHLRSTSSAQRASAIHQRRGPGRRDADERLAGQALQRMDGAHHDRRPARACPKHPSILRPSPEPDTPARSAPTLPAAPIYSSLAGRRISTRRPMPHRCPGNGEQRAGTRSPAPTSSASTARWRARFARVHASISTRAWTQPICSTMVYSPAGIRP